MSRPNNLLRFFEYKHLKPEMQKVSYKFHLLAHELEALLPSGPEKTVAFRKLLEAKDAAVRSTIPE